jgi:hypothetical protein
LAKDSGFELGFGRFNSMVRAHHESDAEFYGRREPDMDQLASDRAERRDKAMGVERAPLGPLPGGGKAVLTVAIPVVISGHEGQRGQWVRGGPINYEVTLKDTKVVLKNGGAGSREIEFDLDGLKAALQILEDYR